MLRWAIWMCDVSRRESVTETSGTPDDAVRDSLRHAEGRGVIQTE
jgi:hypothetical protein